MARLVNEDVAWYVATQRKTGAHWVFNENYMEKYQNEFERVREFDTIEDAIAAKAAREDADEAMKPKKAQGKAIKISKIRGDIKKGSLDDEKTRATIKAEIEAEMAAAIAEVENTTKKSAVSKPTKDKVGL